MQTPAQALAALLTGPAAATVAYPG
jgi:hypothetical protein